MDYINRKVKHKIFGIGTIMKIEKDTIFIEFNHILKKFSFPSCFNSFLILLEEQPQQKEIEINALEYNTICEKTNILKVFNTNILGLDCSFNQKFNEQYILIFQTENTTFASIINNVSLWNEFKEKLNSEIENLKFNKKELFVIYIINEDTKGISIQSIESSLNDTRNYVLSLDETINFINKISQTSNIDINTLNPLQLWISMLDKISLTGCLTGNYFNKNVIEYINGNEFNSNELIDINETSIENTKISQINNLISINNGTYRNFCLGNNLELSFAQVNLFFGSNGSGKTSILEGIEYALTAKIRRLKDFKLPFDKTEICPKIKAINKKGNICEFFPSYSNKNSKEIERVWYGTPISRNKTTLNEQFTRFNYFDAEAVYNFVHSKDENISCFSVLFSNLIFGESAVGYEKKWLRYKKAFEEEYKSIQRNLQESIWYKNFYELLLSNTSESYSDEIEKLIEELGLFVKSNSSPKERYTYVSEQLILITRYVERLENSYEYYNNTIEEILKLNKNTQKKYLELQDKKQNSSMSINNTIDKISKNNKSISTLINKRGNIQINLQEFIDFKSIWTNVSIIHKNPDMIDLLISIENKLSEVNELLNNISKLEQRPNVLYFIEHLTIYFNMSLEDFKIQNQKIQILKEEYNNLLFKYENQKKLYQENEKKIIELNKMGIQLITSEKCPLCGYKHSNVEDLKQSINNNIHIEDANLVNTIEKINKLKVDIDMLQDNINMYNKIELGRKELNNLIKNTNQFKKHDTDYKWFKNLLEEKKYVLDEYNILNKQLNEFDSKGINNKNVDIYNELKTNHIYIDYENYQNKQSLEYYIDTQIKDLTSQLQEINKKENSLNNDIELLKHDQITLEQEIKNFDIEISLYENENIQNIVNSIDSIKKVLKLSDSLSIKNLIDKYNLLSDKCTLEIERLSKYENISYNKSQLEYYSLKENEYLSKLQRVTMVLNTFNSMPTLDSLVNESIHSNIELISKYFRRIHHSGEFSNLNIDENGFYAIRKLDSTKVRVFEMSTGQRTSLALSVMLTLYTISKNCPKILLLDEPLATMDDIQSNTILDIIYELAKNGTQIFFTTANSQVVKTFRNRFKNTSITYSEFEFIKFLNDNTSIKQTNYNK